MLGITNYLYRLVPANPILLRVVQSGGKRRRDLLFRCGYLGVLVFLVIFLLLSSSQTLAGTSLSALSKQSAQIFYYMSYVQLGLVTLLAPIFTAGAITQERDSQTYDILLSTPLTNGQIVLGSLLSRLFFVLALLISGIPIFAATQIFGGVAIRDIALSFLIAAATAFITGAVAVVIAVFKVGTRRTIFSFYLVILLYISIPLTLESMGYLQYTWTLASNVTTHVSWFAGIHPFLALRVIFGEPGYRPPEPGTLQDMSWLLRWYLSSPHSFYIVSMFVLSFVLVIPSIIMLRLLAQSTYTFRAWLLKTLRLTRGDRTRNPRRVWSNPIAWREARTKASAGRAITMRYGFMTIGLAAAVALIILSSTRQPAARYVGAAGYSPADGVVTIVEDGQPIVYRVHPPRGRGPSGPLPTVQLNSAPADLGAVREGVVVANMTTDPADRRQLRSLLLEYPRMYLNERSTRQFLLGAIIVELAVILLILTQSAASTVTREKEDGTLDLLLSTPITSRYYIWGKLRGLVSFVLPLVAVPIASVLLFVIHDLLRSTPWRSTPRPWIVYPEALIILPGTLLMVAAFAAILGMQMSLRCRKTVMAVMSSVGVVGGVTGALWLCGASAAGSSNLSGPGIGISCFSPFTLMSLLIDPIATAGNNFGSSEAAIVESRVLVFFAGWAATICYGLVVWSLYRSMVRNFDMTIRRQAT